MSLVIWLNIVTIVADVTAFFPHTCAKASMPLVNCIVNDGQCHAKHAENAASVHNTCIHTRSSAVAERPRDASCH